MQVALRLFQQTRSAASAASSSFSAVRRFSTSSTRYGIEEFFDLTPGYNPLEKQTYGNAWTCDQLRKKSFEDLHKLWYILIKEQNKLASERYHVINTLKKPLPDEGDRLKKVKLSMIRLKFTLTERAVDTAKDGVELAAMKQLIKGPKEGRGTAYLTVPDYREKLEAELVSDPSKRVPRETYEVFPKKHKPKKIKADYGKKRIMGYVGRRKASKPKGPFRTRKHMEQGI